MMLTWIVGILSALITLVALVYEKVKGKSGQKILMLLGIVGFMFTVAQIGLSEIEKKVQTQNQLVRDSIVSDIKKIVINTKANVDSIHLRIKNIDISSLGIQLNILDSDAFNLKDSSGDPIFHFGKTNYEGYKKFFNAFFQNADQDSISLSLKLGAGHNYKLHMVLKFLLTNRSNYQRHKNSNNYFNEKYIGVQDIEATNSNSLTFQNILFFNENNELLGYCETKEFIDEIVYYYFTDQETIFDNRINDEPDNFLTELKSLNRLITSTTDVSALAKYMINESKTECLNVLNDHYYQIHLSKILTFKHTMSDKLN